MPLIPALGRLGQADLYEFKATLVYTVNSIQASQGYVVRPYLKKEKQIEK